MNRGKNARYSGIELLPDRGSPPLTTDSLDDMAQVAIEASRRSGGLIHLQVTDQRSHAPFAIELDAATSDAQVRHLNHPEPGTSEQFRLQTLSKSLEATYDLVRRLTGSWHGPHWKPFDPGAKRRDRGAARLHRIYRTALKENLLSWCDLMDERDRTSDNLIQRMSDALSEKGIEDVLPLFAADSSDEHSDMMNMIEGIRNAESGEDVIKAVLPVISTYDPKRERAGRKGNAINARHP
ncbi:MAG: hypothetical protein OXC95_11495 [Dehalococcoidia bacterium]|nr:hypothetical protein [Dehalococcoidia bacterium]